jgi:hypothetical protein
MKPRFASTSTRRAITTALIAVALGLTVAACGSSSSSSSSDSGTSASGTTTGTQFQARLNLAKCFRAHGINVPDPSSGGGPAGGGGVFRALRSYPQSEIQTATQACRQYFAQAFPRLNLSPAQRAQAQQQLVKFAECMRSHGVDIPDPTFSSGGGFGFRRAFGSVDRNSPAFQSALSSCQSLRPRFGRAAGGGTGSAGIVAPAPGGPGA